MIESRQLLKDHKQAKEDIFGILETVLVDNSSAVKNFELKLINLIYEEEQLVEPISELITKAYKSPQAIMSKLATETLTMLVNYIFEKTNVNAESQAVKNTREILCRVAQQIPKAFYNHLSAFMCLYESEAYLLRNALTEILTEIIKSVLTQKEDDGDDMDNQEAYKKAKIRLLDKLIKRVNDKNAYSRAHVMKSLVDLCTSNVVPQQYLKVLLQKGYERIKDISANVRKKALELLDRVIRIYYNLFVGNADSGFLSIAEVQRQQQFNSEEGDDIRKRIRLIEEQARSQIRGMEEYEKLQSELKIQRRKLESIKTHQEHVTEYLNMFNVIEKITPNLLQLLGSKNIGDVTESIRLFVTLKLFKVTYADAGIKKMLVLIWSKEKGAIEELLKAYWRLYFDSKTFSSEQIALNLINLYNSGSLTERTSIEELILTVLNKPSDEKDQNLKEERTFHTNVFKILWNIFLAGYQRIEKVAVTEESDPTAREKESTRTALTLLRIANSRKKDILESRIDSFSIVLNTFLKNNNPDWMLVKEISLIIEKSKLDSPRVNQIIKSILLLILRWHGTSCNEWFCAVEQTINMIFTLKEDPETLIQYLVLQSSKFLFLNNEKSNRSAEVRGRLDPPSPMPDSPNSENSGEILKNGQMIDEEFSQVRESSISNEAVAHNFEEKFSQLIFIVGHVSMKFLLHFDAIEQHFKRLKNEAETKIQAEQKGNATETELDKIGGGIEADFEHKNTILHNISESCVVFKNLLSLYVPYIKKIVKEMISKKESTRNPIVERVVVLTLCKYMCVSNEFCQENLNLLFSLLEIRVDPVTKTNIIIALGDLIQRYPNTTEPFTSHLYQNLQDESLNVRKTTLLVITHLILNDMLKLKAEISDIALLFEDPDPTIQNLVKLFFHELHKKDSKIIYNLLPEAIGRLSRVQEVSEAVFQTFAKNIMQYLEKEKYSEILVEKLCTRLANTESPKELRNSAFCLSMLSYNEKGLRKLIEMFDQYRDKLKDEIIDESFRSIVAKMKKFNKAEVKPMIEDLEAKLDGAKNDTGEERKRKMPENKKNKSKRKGGTKNKNLNETNSIINEEEDDEESYQSEPQAKKGAKSQKNGPQTRLMALQTADDSNLLAEIAEWNQDPSKEIMITFDSSDEDS